MLFHIQNKHLIATAVDFKKEIQRGTTRDKQVVACLPSYISLQKIPRNGKAIVVDFGGTNVRVAIIALKDGELFIEKGPITESIPIKRGIPLEREDFLNSLCRIIASLDPPQYLPIGYCFSYPAESTLDGDAKLLHWTKELFVKDTIGQEMGKLLLAHLSKYTIPIRCSGVCVINDTVASLLAGLTVEKADNYIGFIVGTGNNMAVLSDSKKLVKFDKELQWKGSLPVNLESGNYTPPYLTIYDNELDAKSVNPGCQRFEKAVSGIYLSHLLKKACPESEIPIEAGSKGVTQMAYDSRFPESKESKMARGILERSAKLVAASLAGAISFLYDSHGGKKICITAEGALFWGHKNYKKAVEITLKELLKAMELPEISIKFITMEHTNLLGSAVAALTKN